MSSSDRVAQLYTQVSGSLLVVFYDSQGYGGGILTRLHTGKISWISNSKTMAVKVFSRKVVDYELED
jgi:hypothetical protein